MLRPKFIDPIAQNDAVLTPDQISEGVIVSPDTHRANRVPPGQSRTLKWPVLDASGAPKVDLNRWKFQMSGLVNHEVSWNWQEFQQLPRVKVYSDFHCVTRWSRLGNLWEGVSTRHLAELAGGGKTEGRGVLAYGLPLGWVNHHPVNAVLARGALGACPSECGPKPGHKPRSAPA